jgi:hypothetical protein
MKTKQALLWVAIELTARGDAGEIPLAAADTCNWKLERARPVDLWMESASSMPTDRA